MEELGIIFDKVITKKLCEIYFKVLENIPIERVRYRAKIHMREEKYFPKPCEIGADEDDSFYQEL